MDFLKKNGFAVGLGALGLGALVLLWFMVLGKVFLGGSISAAKETLQDKIIAEYKKYEKKNLVPTKELREAEEKAQKQRETALKEGEDYYAAKRDRFDEWFGNGNPDDPSGFKGIYQSELTRLRAAYLAAFQQAAPPADGGAAPPPPETGAPGTPPPAPPPPSKDSKDAKDAKDAPPVVSEYSKFNDAEDVKRAMKELWMVSEVYNRLTELRIPGLLTINFPDRDKERMGVADTHAGKDYQYRWIRCKTTIEMPFAQTAPFLAKLFSSDRIAYRLESLQMKRRPETAIVDDVIVTKAVDDLSKREKVENVPPEPPVVVELEISALNWIGTPPPDAAAGKAEKKGDEEGDEDASERRKSRK